MNTHLNRRHLGGIILAAGASSALAGCALGKTLEGDIATTFNDAVAAAKAAAAAVASETEIIVTAISTTPAGAVSGWQQILGLAEQALLAVASTNPIVATIEAAISAGTTIVAALPVAVSDATQLASTLGALTTATSTLRDAVTSAGAFTIKTA